MKVCFPVVGEWGLWEFLLLSVELFSPVPGVPVEALHCEACAFPAHEAPAGVCQPKEWGQSGEGPLLPSMVPNPLPLLDLPHPKKDYSPKYSLHQMGLII